MIFDQSTSPFTAPTSFCARIMLFIVSRRMSPGPQYGTPPFFSDASSARPNPVAPGGTATLQASATSSQTYTDANILFDVFDSTGTRVYYISRHHVNFTGGVVQTFMGTWSVPSTQAAGPYMLKFGVFTATWSTLYAYKTCTTFSVASGATALSRSTPLAGGMICVRIATASAND